MEKTEKGYIATEWLIIGFAIGMGTWRSMAIGVLFGLFAIRKIKS